jgi:quercetin dioxygenase-like cupin family protein
MEIKRTGSQPSAKGSLEWFTGTVRVDPRFQAPDPARVSGASVTFEPGPRTAWHTHPLGHRHHDGCLMNVEPNTFHCP